MNTQIRAAHAENAPAVIADIAEENIIEGIEFGAGRRIPPRVRKKLIEGARAVNTAVHEHPYESIGIAFSVGGLIGCLLARHSKYPAMASEVSVAGI